MVRKVRKTVLGALEPRRADKTIGSSLEAAPQVFVTPDIAQALTGIDLAEVCITSQALLETITPPGDAFTLNDTPGVAVVFKKAEGKKCQRSWKILPEVGSDKDYPDLTKRDADAVRWYARQKKAA
jgi:isoleucyl-tRNA synthetase